MATSVDSVVLELEARLGSYNNEVTGAANSTERALARIDTAATNTERNLGRTRAGMQQLSFQIGDISQGFALGVRPMTIFAQQSGQVIQALQVMGGEGNAVLRFLAGPWGIAVTAAATVLLPLIGNLIETSNSVDELVDKLKEEAKKAEDSARAHQIFDNSIEGVTKALNDNRAALEKLNLVQDTSADHALKVAETERIKAVRIRETTEALLNQALAAEQVLISTTRAGPGGAEREGATAAGLQSASARVTELSNLLTQARTQVAEANRQVSQGRASVVVEHASETKEETINRLYDGRVDAARRLATQLGTVDTLLEKEVRRINAARDADLKRIKDTSDARKRHGNNSETGRELSGAQAAGIARAAGLQVNSSDRTFAQQKTLYDAWVAAGKPSNNPVAKPGTSAHEGANGHWALDVQLGPGVTPELLRKVFAAQGVNLTKVFKEQGHYHIEGSRSQAAQEENAQARAAEQAEKAAQKEQQRYDTAKGRLALEGQLDRLRASGLLEDAQQADILESNYRIESQFPELAASTNQADQARLQVLKDIANAAINEAYGRKEAERAAARQKSMEDQLSAIGEDAQKVVQDSLDKAARHQEDQVRTLAGLYADLFRGGTKSIWDNFKQIGLSVIAEVLAKFTVAQINGSKFNLGDALSSAIGLALPGFGSSGGTGGRGDALGLGTIAKAPLGGGRAMGGSVTNGVAYDVGEFGKERFIAPANGVIVPNDRIMAGAGGQSGVATVRLVLSEDIDARIQQVSGPVAVEVIRASAPQLIDASANETLRRAGRPSL